MFAVFKEVQLRKVGAFECAGVVPRVQHTGTQDDSHEGQLTYCCLQPAAGSARGEGVRQRETHVTAAVACLPLLLLLVHQQQLTATRVHDGWQ